MAQDQMSQFKMYLQYNSVINSSNKILSKLRIIKPLDVFYDSSPKYLHFLSNDIDESGDNNDGAAEPQLNDQYMGKVKVLLKR